MTHRKAPPTNPSRRLYPAAKVLETPILPSTNEFLSPAKNQHGFRPRHSTTSTLLHLITDMRHASTSGNHLTGIQRVYKTVYSCEEPILEPVDHQIQQPTSTQQMYGEDLRQQREQHRDPLHTLGPMKRQIYYVTALLNDTHRKTYQNALTTY